MIFLLQYTLLFASVMLVLALTRKNALASKAEGVSCDKGSKWHLKEIRRTPSYLLKREDTAVVFHVQKALRKKQDFWERNSFG